MVEYLNLNGHTSQMPEFIHVFKDVLLVTVSRIGFFNACRRL